MKQITKYISAFAAMLLFTTGAMADNTATVIKQINGAAAGTINPGEVTYSNGTITVTPSDGYYLTVADLKVEKTIDGQYAEARRRTPGIDNTVTVTATDPNADPSGTTTYKFTVTDKKYDYEITANFHSRAGIGGVVVTVLGGPFTYNGSAIKPDVTVVLGGTTLTKGTDYDVYYADSINAGTGKITVVGTRTYAGTQTGIAYTINKAAGSISYAKTSVSKTFGNGAFTHALTNTGDGAVSYVSSTPSVATVNATTGEVTIVGNGSATITATVADGANYTYATKTAAYTLTVKTAAMSVTATGYSGTYDGKAYGITVNSPEGATVTFGEAQGTYNLNASPTYTNAGYYNVYYQVTKPNYTTVTGSQAVIISKAEGSISYAVTSIDKTYGDAAFTNPLTIVGDGTANFTSSDVKVATVNNKTGEVTITGSGSATITATVNYAYGKNYSYTEKTASYSLNVAKATMTTVTATGYTGIYDGDAHGITVTAPEGSTVRYGETEGTYDLIASPAYTDAGTYTVYYEVTKASFTTVTGSATVTIAKADATVKFNVHAVTAKIGNDFDQPQLTVDPADLVVTYSSSDPEIATVDEQTGKVELVAPGDVTITATFAGNANYNSASDAYVLTVLQRDIDPIDEDVVYTMNEEDFFTLDEDGNVVEVKLDNTVIYDILFTLDIIGDPSETDGYDETEHCIVLNHPMSTNDINSLIFNGVVPGTDEYAEQYTGLTFKVPAGRGYVIIDAQTDGEYQMMVKIGELAPIAFNHKGREKDSVLYECTAPTWVYVYNGGKIVNTRIDYNHRSKKDKGTVRIYSVTRSSSTETGIERIDSEAIETIERWYDLQGNRIARPTKKGLYILRGKKVIVR